MRDLLRSWRRRRVSRRPSVTRAALAKFEAKHRVELPGDFRDYLRRANGAEMDDRFFSFASIDEIAPVKETCPPRANTDDLYPGCFVFADYLIHAWIYAIQLDGNEREIGRVFCVVDQERVPTPIASSFSEWTSLYLDDSSRLHPRG